MDGNRAELEMLKHKLEHKMNCGFASEQETDQLLIVDSLLVVGDLFVGLAQKEFENG